MSMFQCYTKTDEIKQWVQELQDSHQSSLQTQIDRNHSEFQYYMKKIMGENLMVPHLIGDGLKYKNLKEYIQGRSQEVDKNFENMKKQMEHKISESIKIAKQTLSKSIFDAKTHFNNIFTALKIESDKIQK